MQLENSSHLISVKRDYKGRGVVILRRTQNTNAMGRLLSRGCFQVGWVRGVGEGQVLKEGLGSPHTVWDPEGSPHGLWIRKKNCNSSSLPFWGALLASESHWLSLGIVHFLLILFVVCLLVLVSLESSRRSQYTSFSIILVVWPKRCDKPSYFLQWEFLGRSPPNLLSSLPVLHLKKTPNLAWQIGGD